MVQKVLRIFIQDIPLSLSTKVHLYLEMSLYYFTPLLSPPYLHMGKPKKTPSRVPFV